MRTISELEQALVAGGDDSDLVRNALSNGFEGNGWAGSGANDAMGGQPQASAGGTGAAVKGVVNPADCRTDVHGGMGVFAALGGVAGGAIAGLVSLSTGLVPACPLKIKAIAKGRYEKIIAWIPAVLGRTVFNALDHCRCGYPNIRRSDVPLGVLSLAA